MYTYVYRAGATCTHVQAEAAGLYACSPSPLARVRMFTPCREHCTDVHPAREHGVRMYRGVFSLWTTTSSLFMEDRWFKHSERRNFPNDNFFKRPLIFFSLSENNRPCFPDSFPN